MNIITKEIISKKNILFLAIITSAMFAYELIHPLDFKGSEEEKTQVIKQIEKNVEETYCAIGMCDASTLRMMEEEELNSFKELMNVENRKLLDSVIATYCEIGMCSYSTILMMYEEELSASKQKLGW